MNEILFGFAVQIENGLATLVRINLDVVESDTGSADTRPEGLGNRPLAAKRAARDSTCLFPFPRHKACSSGV